MATAESETAGTKRTFEQTGLDDGQDLSGDNSAEGRKLVHLTKPMDDEPQQTSLTSLPVELLISIASYLSTAELLSFRLTSRAIEVALFNDFAAYYFAKKQFMLTYESLQCLVEISLHPKLSTVLQHVILSIEKYHPRIPPVDLQGNDLSTSASQSDKYFQGFYDQTALLNSGHSRDLLAQAFRNLRNLKTIGLRDYNNGRRWRDGEGAEWRAYGASTVLRETGVSLLPLTKYHHVVAYGGGASAAEFSTRVFTELLHALGSSGARPEAVEILLRTGSDGLPDPAFHIPRFLEPTMAPVLSSLTTLLLTLNLRGTSWPSPGVSIRMRAIRNFLSLTSNLTHLRFNFQRAGDSEEHQFLDWLADSDPAAILPKLEKLDFGMMVAGKLVAREVVKRFGGTLRALSFWKVTLTNPDLHGMHMPLDEKTRNLNLWADFLAKLPSYAPGLERISVGCLRQHVYLGQMADVSLMLQSKKKFSRGPDVREYTRDDMRDPGKFRQLLREELQPALVSLSSEMSQSDDSGT